MPHTTRPRTPDERIAFRRRCLRAAAAVGFTALVGSVLIGGPAQADHETGHVLVGLPGSNFEIDQDANLKLDHDEAGEGDPQTTQPDYPDAVDWASFAEDDPANPNDNDDPEKRKLDLASGAGDDSFGQGSKEDTLVPTVVDGSIPPNKSDLKTFAIYLEETAGDDFLHMFWHRVQDPTGTTNMDFEFNQKKATPEYGNTITPERTAGDLLIQYDLANGGTVPELFLSEWVATGNKSLCEAANSTPCWGDRINLSSSGDATGSINTSAIPSADSDGLGNVSPRTFGEATVNFSEIVGSGCVAFGSAYLKSRSSDSFTAAMKDFIAPLDTGISNCGALVVEKTMKDATLGLNQSHPQENVEFTVTGGSLPAAGEKILTDADGIACLSALEAGTYTVKETVPTGYASTDDEKTAIVAEDTDCDDDPTVSFSNLPLTDVTVSVDSLIPGGTFSSIECDATVEDPDTEPDVSLDDELDDPSVLLEDLVPGTYTCVVVIDP